MDARTLRRRGVPRAAAPGPRAAWGQRRRRRPEGRSGSGCCTMTAGPAGPRALEQMLRVATAAGPLPSSARAEGLGRPAGAARDGDHGHRAGRRLTGAQPGEDDDGEHDEPGRCWRSARRECWSAATSGMRSAASTATCPCSATTWTSAACARAGDEVRIVTDAVVYHRDLSARLVRPVAAVGGRNRMLDRRSALYVFAVNLPLGPMTAIVGGCVVGSLVRAAYFRDHQAAAPRHGSSRRAGAAVRAPWGALA